MEYNEEQKLPEQENPVQQNPQPYQSGVYGGAGVGRKESPFANSPYVMNRENGSGYDHAYTPPVQPREPWEHQTRREVPQKKKRAGNGWKRLVVSVLVLALVAGSCGLTAYLVDQKWSRENQVMVDSLHESIRSLQEQINTMSGQSNAPVYMDAEMVVAPGYVYDQNVDSVVLITSEITTSAFGQSTTGVSTGSGFVLTEDGYVVTNHHVIEGANNVTVTMYDGTKYAATVVGSDSTNDVALLKISETVSLPAVTVGSSDELRVGDQVVAIGNPLGELTSTLTVGYVSAKERNVTTEGTTINMIQTDAAINSGNSGGPLFNMQGEVVGITTAKYSGSSSSGATIEGIGFAIPIDDVMPLVEDLKIYGYIKSAYLGVMVSDMDEQTGAVYGLPVGAYVREVTPGYCAEEAGLKVKDIIVKLGEYEVKNLSDLTRALRLYKAGDTTTITVFRSGEQITLPITLDEKPQTTQEPTTDEKMPENGTYEEWFNYFFPFGKGND